MITVNAMDVFTIVLGNGNQFSLIAKDKTMAMQLAMALNTRQLITNVYRRMEDYYHV